MRQSSGGDLVMGGQVGGEKSLCPPNFDFYVGEVMFLENKS